MPLTNLTQDASGTYASGAFTSQVNWGGGLGLQGNANYLKVGNTVTVSGYFVGGTSATGNAVFEMALPFASNFTAQGQLAGSFHCPSQAGFNGAILADTSTGKAKFQINSTAINFVDWYFEFTYTIV